MNCVRNARSLLSQIAVRCNCKAPATLIRGSVDVKPACRRLSTSPRRLVLRWYHEPRKVAAATAITLGAMAMAAYSRYREIVPCTYRSHLLMYSHQEERDKCDSSFAEHKAELVEQNRIVDPCDPRIDRVRLIAERIVHAAHRGLGIYDRNDAPMLRVTQKRRRSWGNAPPHTAHLRGLNWEVTLFRDPHPNAFIYPSGKIMVTTGLFDSLKTDDEIAAILAHELGHVIARHVVEINNSAFLPEFLHNIFESRWEIEADYIGILLLGAAGFHPQWALVAMEKLAKSETNSVLGNTSLFSHPKPEKRLQLLSEAMKEALELYMEVIAMDKVTGRYFR